MVKHYHVLERTSPKGPGQKFIGVCTRCGEKDLPMSAVHQECANIRGVSDDDALVEAISPDETKDN